MLVRYIVKRILQLLPLIIAIGIICFIIIQLPPGDYATVYANRLRGSGITVTDGMLENIKQQYGLDKSMVQQFLTWVRNLVRGDMGRSFIYNRPVSEVLLTRISMSMLISMLTLVFVWVIAIPIGIYSATHQYSPLDYGGSLFSYIGVAVPGFLVALFVIYQIYIHTGQVFTGLNSQQYMEAPWSMAKFLDMLPRLLLAVFLIGMPSIAQLSRTMRAMMLDELQKQYVTTARAKGLSEKRVLFRYPVRMAVNPMISTIGWTIPALVSGEVIISIVLNLPTTGPMLRLALSMQDMYLAASFLLIVGILTVVGTLISDVLLAAMDPRIRFGGVPD